MPHLERITLHPVKSLDGLDVERARVLPCGALADDRRWRLVDLEGHVVHAKRTPLVHAIRAVFDLSDGPTVALSLAPDRRGRTDCALLAPQQFPLLPGPNGPCGWLSVALGMDVLLQERPEGGFPDDRDAPGPTLVSTASLEEVARWFSLSLEEVRRRFRANLEVGDCGAFWEDRLACPAPPPRAPSDTPFGPAPCDSLRTEPVPLPPLPFRVGRAGFTAVNTCRRCPVPARDTSDGRTTEHFREIFEAWRRRRLPSDVDASAWGDFYRLAIHTIGDGQGGNVHVGDRIEPAAHACVS